MSDTLNISDGAYILVADGTGGRLFSAVSDQEQITLTQVDVLTPCDPQHRGTSGSRPPEQTESQTKEATFAKHSAEALYTLAHAGTFSELVVIADPQTLGQMRDVFHKEVTDHIVHELPKTLTNLSHQELEEYLSN